jgi:hypothetical protein
MTSHIDESIVNILSSNVLLNLPLIKMTSHIDESIVNILSSNVPVLKMYEFSNFNFIFSFVHP